MERTARGGSAISRGRHGRLSGMIETMTSFGDLLGGPPPTLLPGDEEAESQLLNHADPRHVAARFPSASIAWAELAEKALADGQDVTAYAYARTGYHRGLDQLRRNGWKGFGPVPWSHEGNRGFLRAVGALTRAAGNIGETAEYDRCLALLDDCDDTVAAELGLR